MNWAVILISLFQLILCGIFLFRYKLLTVLGWSLKSGFVIATLLVIAALFFPAFFEWMAGNTLESAGTLNSIRSIDQSFDVNKIIQPGKNIIDRINDILNNNPSPTPAPQEQIQTKGPLETQVYPGLVTSLGGIYRVGTLLLGLAGTLAVIYLSYAAAGSIKYALLEEKFQKLEKRLKVLEAAQKAD